MLVIGLQIGSLQMGGGGGGDLLPAAMPDSDRPILFRVNENENCCRTELNIGHNVSGEINAQSTIMKRCLKDTFKFKTSIFVNNLNAYLILQVSTNHRYGTYACFPKSFRTYVMVVV